MEHRRNHLIAGSALFVLLLGALAWWWMEHVGERALVPAAPVAAVPAAPVLDDPGAVELEPVSAQPARPDNIRRISVTTHSRPFDLMNCPDPESIRLHGPGGEIRSAER